MRGEENSFGENISDIREAGRGKRLISRSQRAKLEAEGDLHTPLVGVLEGEK